MKQSKKRRLEGSGWKAGDAGEFLGLTEEEIAYIEMKLALAESLRELRRARKISQTQLARLLGSSQSRIAKMESCDPSVSVDLLVKGMLALGATRQEIGKTLGRPRSAA
ncbi:MAG: helix-turn-helix domain-containing protein [Gammaproteobacteria bacterium]|nr:helix-turn-helix domain-containing protein [Gammaproteobacteria bacterium]